MTHLAAFAALCSALVLPATLPMPLVGPGCDDGDGDGFVDVPADCPDDYLGCDGLADEPACLGDRNCSWNVQRGTCEGVPWDYSSFVAARLRPRLQEAAELALGSGMHADRAWQVEVGRWDSTVAVFDSGIRWAEPDLRRKHRLNRWELPVPQDAAGAACGRPADAGRGACPEADAWDCNQDCIFNVEDYTDDPRIPSPSISNEPDIYCVDPYNFGTPAPIANDFLEPSDLLCVFADGTDGWADGGIGDGNGYVDDISGWDFLWDDPNPYDDTDYGHGTGEAKDSTAEGGNGDGTPGVCPNCSLLPVRVGDSFVVDANNWAAGVVYGVDAGAKVLQSAVGSINNTSFSQAAIEYAWDRGVINIVSAADETAQHQNYPGAVRHTAYVHAVRYDAEDIDRATTFLNFSNCTNYGARLTLSAPSTSCSSGATGVSSGISGLIASAMQDAIDAGTVTAAPGSATGLTGPEILGLLYRSVDDIDLPSSQPGSPEYDGTRYPSKPGWDLWFGHGRINARTVVDAVLAGNIPPEADIVEPNWFAHFNPAAGPIAVTGSARAPRAALRSWVLEYGVGVEPDAAAEAWTTIAEGTTPVRDGVLGQFDARNIPGFDPEARVAPYNSRAPGPIDDNVTKAFKVNIHTITLRLRVEDTAGRTSEERRAIYVQHDPTLKPGFPLRLGVSGEAAPKLYDLDGKGGLEIILADADGWVHAITADGVELRGWPVATRPGRVGQHPGGFAYATGALRGDFRSSIVAAPAIGDLDGDGIVEVVAATLDGELYAWTVAGTLRPGFPVSIPAAHARDTHIDASIEYGIFASPSLGDLDQDGGLDIVIATLDQKVLAYHGDGTKLAGFPVSGPPDPNDRTKPYLRTIVDPVLDPDGQTRRIISSPAIGDLDGDGRLEVVVGTNEALNDQLSVVYAFTYDPEQRRPVAYGRTCGSPEAVGKNCWPLIMVGGYPNALPYVGEGSPSSPILGDLDGDGTLEVAAASIADFGRIYRHDGFNNIDATDSEFVTLKAGGGFYGTQSNSDQSSSLVMINSGAFGDLDGDGVLDYLVGTAGANFVDNLLEDGVRADFDHQLSAWRTDTGEMLAGFPQIMEDLQFFLNPLVADVDGDGAADVINTSATFVVHAFRADGSEPEGWPKFTGQWQIASPAVGDIDGDGLLELAVVTRAGYLFVYELEGAATAAAGGNVQWSSFRHDARNSGNFHTPDPTLTGPVSADAGGCAATQPLGPGAAVLALALGLAGRRRARQAAGRRA